MQRLNSASTLASKLWRSVQDIPWQLAEMRELILPGGFAEFYRMVHPYTDVQSRVLAPTVCGRSLCC